MEHTIESGIYKDCDVLRFYTIEETLDHKPGNKTWGSIKLRFIEFYGKHWIDPRDSYDHEYVIIGVEDNEAWADYYWILEDADGNRKTELCNNADFKKHII